MTQVYLDPTPLLDAARAGRPWHTEPDCHRCTRWKPDTASVCITNTEAGNTLGVTARTIERWRAGDAQIRGYQAEHLATQLGALDHEIWPHLLEHAISQVTRTCEHCHARFVPIRNHQRFCRPVCKTSAEIARRPPRAVRTTRPCAWCTTEFVSVRANHIYCSKPCGRAAYYDTNGQLERDYQRDYNARYRARTRTTRNPGSPQDQSVAAA